MTEWIVMVGNLYLCGVGVAADGKPCFAFTKLMIRDQTFTSLDSARSTAESFGGQVLKV